MAPHLRIHPRSQDAAPLVRSENSSNADRNNGEYASSIRTAFSSRRGMARWFGRCHYSTGLSCKKIRVNVNESFVNRKRYLFVPVLVIILFFVVASGNSAVLFGPGIAGGSTHSVGTGPHISSTESRWSGGFVGLIPNPPPQSIIIARTRRWKEVENDNCRLASFVNEDEAYHNMAEGAWCMEYADDLRRGHFKAKVDSVREKQAELLDRKREKALEQGKKSISFLHIGKAGGTSIQCNVREARDYSVHCDKNTPFPPSGDKESQISQQINCYIHSPFDDYFECFDNPTLIINTRNPIDRVASWYHYEHIRNKPKKNPTCGQAMLYRCYDSFYDLAEYGLGGIRPPPTKVLRIERDLP